MRLPDLDTASIAREKITDYLLSPTHPEGRSKATFFSRCGFKREKLEQLANALLTHAASHEVTRAESSSFGTRYVIER